MMLDTIFNSQTILLGPSIIMVSNDVNINTNAVGHMTTLASSWGFDGSHGDQLQQVTETQANNFLGTTSQQGKCSENRMNTKCE